VAGGGAAGGVERLGQAPEVRAGVRSGPARRVDGAELEADAQHLQHGAGVVGGRDPADGVRVPGEQRRHLGGEGALAPLDVPARAGPRPPGQVTAGLDELRLGRERRHHPAERLVAAGTGERGILRVRPVLRPP
jgi:hypothetical protein